MNNIREHGINKKVLFIIIIILLSLSLIFTITGIILNIIDFKYETKEEIPKNLNQDFNYQGYLYFYDSFNDLIGTYKCETSNCNYAVETIDDLDYSLRYYEDDKIDHLKVINNRYVFIKDGEKNKLYDLKVNKVIEEYKTIKNYSLGIEEDLFIVRKNTKWGIISLENEVKEIFEFKYDYIGLLNKQNEEDEIVADNFVVYVDDSWKILNSKEIDVSFKFYNNIVDFNGNYIVTKINDNQFLFDYSSNLVLAASGYQELSFVGNYVVILDNSNYLSVYDIKQNKDLTDKILINENDIYDVNIKIGNIIEVTINDKIYEYNF